LRELITGATAVVRGALAAGCDFFAGYPITPATPILLQMLQELPKCGGIAIQGEDEIASIGMCIGAAAAGRRAMTASSGPGMSLYSESIGLALMMELPLVIVDVQRLGPATGGATTVGQGDVQFARWVTAGGYPLIVLAPATTVECGILTVEAFALAERFRCPVILLTDKELNLTQMTVDWPELRASGVVSALPEAAPPAALGGDAVERYTGSSHDEKQLITKDPVALERLNRRLIAKIEAHRAELEHGRLDLQPGARTFLISYGTTAGAMEAGAQLARAQGRCVSTAVVQSLWPVPERLLDQAAKGTERIVVGELNPGLYVREIRSLFADRDVVSLSRIDGELITPEMFAEACLW
jgi:2-oxoglutarate ferredoxin oxidoreductase subunit alpha